MTSHEQEKTFRWGTRAKTNEDDEGTMRNPRRFFVDRNDDDFRCMFFLKCGIKSDSFFLCVFERTGRGLLGCFSLNHKQE